MEKEIEKPKIRLKNKRKFVVISYEALQKEYYNQNGKRIKIN